MSFSQHLEEFFLHPHESGYLTFVSGVLFILSVYHFLLYFQHKDKSYLWYSIYTFLIYFSHLPWIENESFAELVNPFRPFIKNFYHDFVWAYNILYFVFAFSFVNLKSYAKKWYKFLFSSLVGLCIIMLFIDLNYRFDMKISILYKGDHIFLIIISIIAILGYIPLLKAPSKTKYYIVVGSLVLFISSVVATIMSFFEESDPGHDFRYSIFYSGVIIENLIFSLGLGHKQKIIMDERNKVQEKLIKQLLENEKLKAEVENKLHQEVELLHSKLEVDKLEKLNIQIQKDFAEQKLASLRSQMNPHFIFNSLNSIKRFIIDNDQKQAAFYLNKFSKLIRKILSSSVSKQVSLAEELEISKLYVNIENIRFNNEIEYHIKIEESIPIHTINVPSLLLQPFLENAIWHGLSSKKGNKKIYLSVKEKSGYLILSIRDNGIGRENSAKIRNQKTLQKDSLGIRLTRERLETFAKLNSGHHDLKIYDLKDKSGMPTGTKVIIKLKINSSEY